tara:strand:- start:335 stop:670 length:336 start_codon:yes stop_codon:yes gene_type:complete
MKSNQDLFEVIRKIYKSSYLSQRNMSIQLGFSLGKLNYCLNRLKKHGLIKIRRFKDSKNKLNYAYVLTPRGMKARTKLTIDYMKLKMKEYDELKNELKIKKKKNNENINNW